MEIYLKCNGENKPLYAFNHLLSSPDVQNEL